MIHESTGLMKLALLGVDHTQINCAISDTSRNVVEKIELEKRNVDGVWKTYMNVSYITIWTTAVFLHARPWNISWTILFPTVPLSMKR